MKKIIVSLFAFFALFFLSCATVENILVLNTSKGSNLFMRNSVIKTKNSKITSVEFDITTNVEKNEVLENPTVNYTYTVSKNCYSEGEEAVLCFENNGKRINLLSKELLFRQLDSKKNMMIRYSSEMDKDDFLRVMKNYNPLNVVLILSDGTEIVVSDKIVNNKINDLRLLVN